MVHWRTYWKMESVKKPQNGLAGRLSLWKYRTAVYQATTTDCYSCVTVCCLWCMNIHTVATIELLKITLSKFMIFAARVYSLLATKPLARWQGLKPVMSIKACRVDNRIETEQLFCVLDCLVWHRERHSIGADAADREKKEVESVTSQTDAFQAAAM